MIVLITGASHTGKTLLAQRLLERYHYPYLSIDHLKMGLIRSGNTDLTPADDDAPANESPVAEKDTLAQAEDPALPAHMSDAEFEAAIEDLSAKNLSDKDYEAAWDKLYDEYSAQADQYRTALEALRGDGMEDGDAAGLRAFTAADEKILLTLDEAKALI